MYSFIDLINHLKNLKVMVITKMQNIKGKTVACNIYSIIMSFVLLSMSIFYQPMTVYASGEQWTDSQKLRFFGEGFFNILSDVVGVLFPTGSDGRDLKQDYENYVLNNDWIQENMTYDEWIASNLGINYQSGDSGNSDVAYSVDLQNSMIDWANDWINNNTGFKYVYSGNSSDYISAFSTQDQFHAYLNLLDTHKNDFVVQFNYGTSEIYVYENFPALVYSSYSPSNSTYEVTPYYNWSVDYSCKVYTYDSNSKSYVTNGAINTTNARYLKVLGQIGSSFSSNTNRVVALNTTQYQMYMSVNAMRAGTEGVQEYYVTDSYKTEHVNNVKNTTTNNIDNSVTYSNVQNWVNNYYVQNTTYPSSNDVYNYINNYEGSGGGSGGGSGSGSDDDDDGWDWGFLDTIAGFFKGLLKALKTALEGILDLLTGVIDLFIGEEQPDGTRSGGIPTIIGKLVAHFLPMLPDWCTQLIGFSVLLSLILGIVKLIRGH